MLDESTSMSIIKAITGENSHTCNRFSNRNSRLSTKIISGVEDADSDVKQEMFTNLTNVQSFTHHHGKHKHFEIA